MLWNDRILTLLGGLAAPLLGLSVRASRRNRLLSRIRTYSELADQLDEKDAESAALLRELVAETVQRLADTDRIALGRRVEPGSLIAFLLFLIPSIAGFVIGLPADVWWKWLVLAASTVWGLIVAAAAWEQVTTSHEQLDQRA